MLEGELAVGQELDQLMRQGCHVFHDVPVNGFNVDHVVVGRSGVYAVETKCRTKPKRGRGAKDAKVVYDGTALRFPEYVEDKSLAQATLTAKWLAKWLSEAIGERIDTLLSLRCLAGLSNGAAGETCESSTRFSSSTSSKGRNGLTKLSNGESPISSTASVVM